MLKRCKAHGTYPEDEGECPECRATCTKCGSPTLFGTCTKCDASSSSGLKNDQGKPMITLVPPEFIEGCARALTFGAGKYGRDNFKKGLFHTRILDAALRHMLAWLRREDLDPESGLSHLDHAAASLAILKWMVENRKDFDDRGAK